MLPIVCRKRSPLTSFPLIFADPRMWGKEDLKKFVEWARADLNMSCKFSSDLLPPTGKLYLLEKYVIICILLCHES